MKATIFTLALIATNPALADIQVNFDEGAPKDRFTVTNTGGCAFGPIQVTLDISTAPSGLIFDVTDQGAGVEVFQPFELVAGKSLIITPPQVSDGQQSIVLNLSALPQDKSVAFTIDVDDTTSDRQITVSGSEISGARAIVEVNAKVSSADFGGDATATIAMADCLS